ncbi:hypothetical protein GCM10007298_02800 [Williamsia phyllosphaerae]|uniref:HTH lysR-type domain-containing protein n=1 Tax=Williamsia phyllosphaerae TaxID=885042 RepID=A0ABQ1U5G4_9NOCA|nr:hypothetical protein GCM10007298_02800 [Williamsia phyllosphaerae]
MTCDRGGEMELRQLTYFVAVSDELSFSRAAERTFISQSAISHQVARLERDLGAALFERSTRTVTITEAGERLLPVARQMIDLEKHAYAAVRDPGSRVRLAANMSFARRSLSAIAEVRERHPDVEIEFVIKNFQQRVDAVVSGDVDIALIRGSVSDPRLRVEQLWVEELVVAVSEKHPLAGAAEVDLRDLVSHPLILPPQKQQVLLHNVIRQAFADVDAVPRYGSPIAADHTAALELINHPDTWTVLYDDQPGPAIALLRERNGRLRVPVSALVRTHALQESGAGERAAIIGDLMARLGAGTGVAP